MCDVLAAEPCWRTRMAVPSEDAALVELVRVLFWIRRFEIVPLPFSIWMPWRRALRSVLPVIVTVPVRTAVVNAPASLKATLLSTYCPPAAVPEFSMREFVRVKFVTPVPRTPLAPVFWTNTLSKDGERVEVRETPAPVVFTMAPPVHVPALVQEPPLPRTARLPAAPVVLRTIPLAAPFVEMLRNFRPAAPIVVFATLRVVPVVDVSVLAVSVAVTVPPPVALKAVFVKELRVRVPVNEIVEPVLLVRSTPLPVVVLIVPA